MTLRVIVVMKNHGVSVCVCQSCCDLKCESCFSCRRSLPPRDELDLRRDFYLSQHLIPHFLTYKSPCTLHLEAPLAFSPLSIHLLSVYQMKIASRNVWMALSSGVILYIQ